MSQLPVQPPNIALPFAENGDKAVIPTDPLFGRASLDRGFPIETQTPLAAGGVAPNRLDFNGLFNVIYQYLYWIQSGGLSIWSNTLNYPVPAIVIGSDSNLYLSLQPSGPGVTDVGPKDPTIHGDYWKNPLAGIGLLDYALVGSIMYMPTTTLSSNFMWADGSIALFNNYPQLEQKYTNGELAGYVLPNTSTSSERAANPGKFVVNNDTTGLYLPRLNNYFLRSWSPGATGQPGQAFTDTGRNITGNTDTYLNYGIASGSFSVGNYSQGIQTIDTATFGYHGLNLNAAAQWGIHAGNEFAPIHTMIPTAIYLGIYI